MPARFRAPKRCKKANVFPCKGECIRRTHWKSGKEQVCRNVAVGTPATYLEWMAQQTKVLKIENKRRKAKGQALAEMEPSGYLRDRPQRPLTTTEKIGRAKDLRDAIAAFDDKELNQAIQKLATQGGSLRLKRALFAEKKKRGGFQSRPQPTVKQDDRQPEKKPQSKELTAIANKLKGSKTPVEAFGKLTDGELDATLKLFGDKQVPYSSKLRRQLVAEIRRRKEPPVESADPSKVTAIADARERKAKFSRVATYQDAIVSGQKLLGEDFGRLTQLGKQASQLRRVNSRASQSVIKQNEAKLQGIYDQANAVIRKLIDNSSVSEKQASDYVDRLQLPKSFRAEDRQAVVDFIRLSNGQSLETLDTIRYTKEARASASKENRRITVKPGDRRAIFHELGHHAEFNRQNTKAAIAQEFVNKRATGPAQLLSLVDPKADGNEYYKPDKFVTNYVGKIYPDKGITEVLSVGAEALSDPKRLLNLAAKDPEHLALVVGMLKQDYRLPQQSGNVIPFTRGDRDEVAAGS